MPYKCSFLLLVVISFSISCKQQKMVKCCHSIFHIRPVNIGFIGFDSAEVKQVVMKMYKVDNHFQNPFDSLSADSLQFVFQNDTMIERTDRGSLLLIGPNVDYIIYYQNSTRQDTITSKLTEELLQCYMMEGHCSPGSSQPRILPVRDIRINGAIKELAGITNYQYAVYIPK